VLADENVVAIARSSFTLNCSATGITRWQYADYGQNTPTGVHNGREFNTAFHGRFSARFDSETSSSLLKIHEVRLSDAGTYTCRKLNSSWEISSFRLQVLGIYVQGFVV